MSLARMVSPTVVPTGLTILGDASVASALAAVIPRKAEEYRAVLATSAVAACSDDSTGDAKLAALDAMETAARCEEALVVRPRESVSCRDCVDSWFTGLAAVVVYF